MPLQTASKIIGHKISNINWKQMFLSRSLYPPSRLISIPLPFLIHIFNENILFTICLNGYCSISRENCTKDKLEKTWRYKKQKPKGCIVTSAAYFTKSNLCSHCSSFIPPSPCRIHRRQHKLLVMERKNRADLCQVPGIQFLTRFQRNVCSRGYNCTA